MFFSFSPEWSGQASSSSGQLEKEIDNFAIRAQKELILLHRMDGSRPSNTVNWLNIRSWCTSHHHIRCKDRVFKTGVSEKQVSSPLNSLTGSASNHARLTLARK